MIITILQMYFFTAVFGLYSLFVPSFIKLYQLCHSESNKCYPLSGHWKAFFSPCWTIQFTCIFFLWIFITWPTYRFSSYFTMMNFLTSTRLVEMCSAPCIVPGYDMLRPMNQFSHRHVYSDNCSCPIEEHSPTMALLGLSCACKCTEIWERPSNVLRINQ